MDVSAADDRGPSVVIIGGANMDICGKSAAPLVRHDSNPGTVGLSHGGVGRNIAHNLALLDVDVSLVTAFGDDAWADGLRRGCEELGIDVSRSIAVEGAATSSYLYISDADGEMDAAINDMSVLGALTQERLAERLAFINSARLCFVDSNLPEETIGWICRNVSIPLFSDPISCAKAPKLAPFIGRLHTLKPNRFEAEVLSGIEIYGDDELPRAADELLGRGLERLFISLGREGLYYSDGSESGRIRMPARQATDATGAGDAMSAALAWAWLNGMDTAEAARAGIAASSIAIESESTVNPSMSRPLIKERMNQAY